MKFNQKVFWRVFLLLCLVESCLFLAGCTAAWLNVVSGLLPSIAAVVNAIVAFAAALQGKTVSSATYAAIQKWQQNVATEIANAEAILASLKQSATTTLIGEFQAVMQSVLQQFTSILSGVDVTDASTLAKLTQFVGLAVAAINAVLALIPLVVAKLASNPSVAELKHYDKLAAKATKATLDTLKETYVAIVDEHTVNTDVNAALDALPRSI